MAAPTKAPSISMTWDCSMGEVLSDWEVNARSDVSSADAPTPIRHAATAHDRRAPADREQYWCGAGHRPLLLSCLAPSPARWDKRIFFCQTAIWDLKKDYL